MRLLLDEGVPHSATERLRRLGHEAEHVLDLALGGRPDDEIMTAAVDRGAAVVTLDSDFHRLLAASQATSPSVVRIRVEGLDGAGMSLLVASVVETTQDELASGAAVSVTNRSIRVRRLPLA